MPTGRTEQLDQPSTNRVSISLKLVFGPVEINLARDDAQLLVNDYKAILQALVENADLLKDTYAKLGGTPQAVTIQGKPVGGSSVLSQMSIAEMIKKSATKKDTDRVLLIAYYLYRVKGVDTFNTTDMKNSFAEARLTDPGNLNQTINNLVKAGKLRPAEEKDSLKAFAITQTGEEEAAALLQLESQ